MSGSKVDLQSLINIQKEIISDVNRIPVESTKYRKWRKLCN